MRYVFFSHTPCFLARTKHTSTSAGRKQHGAPPCARAAAHVCARPFAYVTIALRHDEPHREFCIATIDGVFGCYKIENNFPDQP